MARVFTDGAEMGDLLFFNSVASNFAVSSAQKRSGDYSYQVPGSGSTPSATKDITGISEGYLKFGWRPVNGNSPNGKVLTWGTTGGTELGSLRYSSASKQFSLYTSTGTWVANGTIVIPALDAWYLIELYIKIADAGALALKIDGVADSTCVFSGDTKPGADTTFSRLIYRVEAAGQQCFFDDLALNDTAGATDNSWCGEGGVIAFDPNESDDDANQWLGQDGNNDDNHLNVDEEPSDGDTTYNEASTSGYLDLYQLGDASLSGKTIRRVFVEARARDTVAAGGQIKLDIKPGSTLYKSSAISLLTTYSRIVGPEYTTNPDDSNPWEDADIDGMQIGQEVV